MVQTLEFGRRNVLIGSALLTFKLTMPLDESWASAKSVRYADLPDTLRNKMAFRWHDWPLQEMRQAGSQMHNYELHQSSMEQLVALLGAFYAAGEREGYFFYRRPERRRPYIITSEMLNALPLHFRNRQAGHNKRRFDHALVAAAEVGFYYRA